ncbi:MAG: hypothetical protein OEW17_05890 [Gemmatimonadota bacterium]|nr:hypothetical protein [Gemmatimonadota bacterium]MDH5282648.1 hypothetical protein [Gemmatimonadota bacterium]
MDSDVLKVLGIFLSLGLAGSLTYAAVTFTSAFARRVESRRSGEVDALADQVEDLRVRVEEGEVTRARLVELEERLEFAERMLAQQRDAPRLPGGPDR